MGGWCGEPDGSDDTAAFQQAQGRDVWKMDITAARDRGDFCLEKNWVEKNHQSYEEMSYEELG